MKHQLTTYKLCKTFLAVLLSSLLLCGCNNEKKEADTASVKDEQILSERNISNDNKNLKDSFTVVEQTPVFGTTSNAINAYIASNLKYPQEAKEKGIQGTAYVSFTVDKTGKVCQTEISKSVNKILDEEAVRVISSMPDWEPGIKDGKTVDVKLNLPIKFLLQ